jgi:hypothetical protein
VILRPEAGNPTEPRRLLCRLASIGRLSVDGEADPPVDHVTSFPVCRLYFVDIL